jgi:hypothetical protein
VLPFSKRRQEPSVSDVVVTGEIEVVRERRSAPPPSSRRLVDPDSSTRIAVAKPRSRRVAPEPFLDEEPFYCVEARQPTIVPPSSKSNLPDLLADSDDDMTRLMPHRARLALATSSRRPAPFVPPPTPTPPLSSAYTPTPPSSRPIHPDSRLAITMPPEGRQSDRLPTTPQPRTLAVLPVRTVTREEARAAHLERAPDSLRPVAMTAMVGAEISGKHEPPPTSTTMRTHILTGRPTMSWAAALVVLGVFMGVATSLYARGDGADIASSISSSLAQPSPQHAAASQPIAENPAPQPPAQYAAAPMPTMFATPPLSGATIDRGIEHADRATDHSAPSDPLAALMDTRATGDIALHGSRPTYVAPGSTTPVYTPPAKHWSAPRHVAERVTERVAEPAPPPPPAPAAAPAPAAPSPALVAAADPAPQPAAPAPKSSSKSKSKRGGGGGDSDLASASASDALARAQLEAALR